MRTANGTKQRSASIQALVNKANQWLAESPDEEKDGRKMLASFVTALLMENNTYRGFNYSYWTALGCDAWKAAGEPEQDKDAFIYGPSGDQTRVTFY